MAVPQFRRVCVAEVTNDLGPAPMNTLFNVADMNGDGRPDLLVGGRDGRLVWVENTGDDLPWPVHEIAEVQAGECGGLAVDLDLDGLPDVVNGGDFRGHALRWWQNPGSAGGAWPVRDILRSPKTQFHDVLVTDQLGDGRRWVLASHQGRAGAFAIPVPEDPTREPWPDAEWLATDLREDVLPDEGLALIDPDGCGQAVVFGMHWFRRGPSGWSVKRYARGYVTTVLAVADVDGDGRDELLVSEGDPVVYGRATGGRFAWFKPRPGLWEEHLVDVGLLDAHSLLAADLCGNGRVDVVVGEIGDAHRLAERPPRLLLYENLGGGEFRRHVIDEGTGTHHARLADFRGSGRLDIASRPLHGPDKWKLYIWLNEG